MKKIVLFIITLISLNSFAQGPNWNVPADIPPFCSGSAALTFPNVGNGPGAGNMGSINISPSVPNPGDVGGMCDGLGSTPNPSWYYLQIDDPGDLTFNISQTSGDVDFMLWGPFSSVEEAQAAIQADPTQGVVDCSYSASPTETAQITGAQTGEIYVFLITNFVGTPGQITLQQTGGNGSTNCEIVCGVSLGGDIIVCGYEQWTLTAVFNASQTGNVQYNWSSSNGPIPGNSSSITVTESGFYTVTAQLPNCAEPATDTVYVNLGKVPVIYPVAGFQGPQGECEPCFDLTTQIPLILQGQDIADFDYSFHLDEVDSWFGANPLPNPENFCITQNTTIYVFISGAGNPNCADSTSFELVVNCAFTPPADMVLCDNDHNGFENVDLADLAAPILTQFPNYHVTFHSSEAGANAGGVDVIPTEVFVAPIGETQIWVRLEHNTDPTVFAVESFTITVNSAPDLLDVVTDYELCDTNGNGQAQFNLNTKASEILNNATATLTYHTSQANAEAGNNPINPIRVSTGETIWVRGVNADGCYDVTSFNLVVKSSPKLSLTVQPYGLCDEGTGSAIFDLTSKENEFLITTADVITYHLSQTSAELGDSAIEGVTSYESTGGVIWVRAENANGCYSVTSFSLVVNALPQANSPEPLYVCNDGTGIGSFNLSAIESVVSGGAPGVSVTFHESLEDAEAGENALVSPYNGTHGQLLYIRVENNLGCVVTSATVQLFLEESTVAPVLEALEYCDPNSDGWGYFDLTQVAQIIFDANPNPVTITYHETIEDAQFFANEIQNPSNYANIGHYTQTIYIAIKPNSGAACSTIATVQLIVHNLPQLSDVTPLEMCDDDYDGFVRFDLTVKAEEVLNGLNPAAHTVRYYPTEDDARNNTFEIMNPTNYQNALADTDSVWIRVDDLNTGCFDVRELILIVNPLPVVDMPNVASYHLCDEGEDGYEVFDLQSRVELILNGQTGLTVSFYDTYDDALSAQNAYTDLMHQNNEQFIETVFVRVETEKGCFVITLMDLVVDPLPVLFPPTEPVVSCDSDGDGYGMVDLTQVIEEMLNGANPNDFAITFHETYTDAELNQNEIDNPEEYFNTDAFAQIIYVRVETTLGSECFNIYPLTINVTASPIIPIEMNGVLPALVECDDNFDGQTYFDLTQQRDYILAAQPNPANLSVSFYTSEQNALDRVLAISNITHYTNTSNPQTIWVVLEDTVTGCYDMASFELEVNVPLVIPPIPSITVCDDDRDLEVFFDLTSRNDIILSNATNVELYTVEFFYTYADAVNGNMANLITNPTSFSNMQLGANGVYTLGVRVTDNVTGCQSYAIMDIRRAPVPNVPTTPLEPLIACDDNGNDDLQEEFDITIYENYVRNGDTFVTITYHENLEDAEAGINAIADPAHYVTGTTTVYIRVANPANGGVVCAVLVPLDIIVNPLPIVADDSYAICETNSTGYAEFFFPDFNPELLGPDQALADFTISYHDTQADAISNSFPINQNNPYTNQTPNSEVIWVRIVNNATGCIRVASITLYAEEGAVANPPSSPIFECDYDGDNDGFTMTDLTQYEAEILQGQNPAQFIVSYYLSEADAHAGENAIVNPSSYTNQTQGGDTIYIRVENSATIAPCYDVTSMQYIVEPLAEPHITSPINTICVDWGNNIANNEIVLDSGVTASGYTFQWYHNGSLISGATQSTYTVNTRGQEGEYYVIAVSDNGCVSEASNTFEVHLSGTADVVEIITDNAFSDNQTITVIVQGYGEYLFQLDDGALQDTGYFVNVTRGEHTITIYDVSSGDINTINSCSPLVIDNVQIIDYPRFFTPNGDGYNDYWNITGFTEYHKAEIHIFDRHGKLLKQLNPTGQGWDGTFNGNPLPSTDYWFKVIYTENNSRKEFKAHFSLKR